MADEGISGSAAPNKVDERLVRLGEIGHVVSGQYITLPNGEYTADFELALGCAQDDVDAIVAIIDVVADWGNHLLAKLEIRHSDLSIEVRSFRLDFSLPGTRTVEFRIDTMGVAELIVGSTPTLGYRYAPMVGFAHAREDVYLWRALAPRVHHDVGFWVDAGAFDPVEASVTKAFYDRGWRGINIEPLTVPFKRLVEQRPRDVNLQLLVSDVEGTETFFQVDNGQLSTTSEQFARLHVERGFAATPYTIEATTLTRICERFAPEEIHFLKIDVEGHETKAIRGMDFTRFRPWIVIVEATEPNRMDRPTHEEWEHMITSAGYDYVLTDLPNRYYVAQEHPDLVSAFSAPADQYIPFGHLREYRAAEERIAALNDHIRQLEDHLATERGDRTRKKARWVWWRRKK